ncbi:MAG TPA: NAD(P) transhydrogenase subunit alpha [Defluviitoga sp.]|nr:NAD(P) transhydrogenase subunit alpha [Defluviitoga sp.]HOP24043.1 NAD(P) transhydrogenase subunit alpha [Defluviitoga sp.]HPZ29255.1 NAD(P) transhydrogenase subunit alpha [Defluviitoga sp.]HQD63141.1 NAD(P) transhydrogenase subunit alpha [Defluviitoga sp.]
MKFKGLTIGVPKEIMEGENRVAAIPETVSKMIDEGARVIIQSEAGRGSHFDDIDYKQVGAEIVENAEQVYQNSDIILKVKEPLFNKELNKHEVDMMKKGQYLITFLHPASPENHTMIKKLAEKGVISFTLDSIPRISKAQQMDALTSMSTVAGYKGFLMAANYLPKFIPLITTAVGTIKPANVLVIGTGVAGLQALATAKRLGAIVYAIDVRSDAREQAQSLGAKIIDVGIPEEIAVGSGGYAKKLPDEWLDKERSIIKEHISNFDIIILTALVPGKVAPILITRDMVESLKGGSVIVDISIDQGGNCELTEPGKIVKKNGITIIGTKNIPGMLPLSSTWLFSKNIYNFLSYIIQDSKINIYREDEIITSTLVTDGNKIVHPGALEAMGIYK